MVSARISRGGPMSAVAVAVCYFAVASIVILTSRAGAGLAVIWPATAILLVQLTLSPRRSWPTTLIAVALASFLATGFFGLGWGAALPLAVFNVSEAVIGAYVLKRRARRTSSFDSLEGFAHFLLAAGLLAPALSGLGGALVTYWLGQDFWSNWLRWAAGHGLGTMIFTPFILLLASGEWRIEARRLSARQWARSLAALAGVVAVALAIFAQGDLSLLFVTILPVVLTTFTIGRLGSALSIVALATVGAVCTMMGLGPVAALDRPDAFKIVYFQGFLAVLVLTVLPVAAELRNRRMLNDRLAESEARYRLLTEASSDIILNIATDGTITFASPSVTALGGYSEEEVIGKTATELVDPDFRQAAADAHRRTLLHPEETQMIEYLARMKDGSTRWFESNMKAVLSDEGEVLGAVNSIRNIDHRKAREEQLYEAAGTDMLTRLLTRDGFLDSLGDFARSGRPGCLALFDLDHLATVNARHGRFAGDRLLTGFADIARRSVRNGDLIGRIGGEEFAILLPRASRKHARAVCERILSSLAGLSLTVDNVHDIGITASAGIVEILPGEDETALLARAQSALDQAKHHGGDRLHLAA